MVLAGVRQVAASQMEPTKLSIQISAKRLQCQAEKSVSDCLWLTSPLPFSESYQPAST